MQPTTTTHLRRIEIPTEDCFPLEAGRQCQGQLWCSLKEILDLLRSTVVPPVNTENLLFQHVRYKAGQRVHSIGQAFDSLYVVNSGFLKTVLIDEFGDEQVLGFPMKGDVIGVDGLHSRSHASEAVALSDCDVVLLPYKRLLSLGRVHVEFEAMMYEVMSRELVREQAMIGMLGVLGAEARVARFLMSLAERFGAMGYSNRIFNLRMTRQEIGSYLGLTLETVSRTLSTFHKVDLITVNKRTICIKNAEALNTLRRVPPSRSPRVFRNSTKLVSVHLP